MGARRVPVLALAAFLLVGSTGCAYHRENAKAIGLAHYRMGDAELQKGRGLEDELNRRKAYPEFVKAIEKDPKNPLFHIGLGNLYLYNRQYGPAREQYLEALRLDPQNPEAHQNMGQLLLTTEKYEEAIAEFDKALTDYSYQTPATAHFNKGRAYFAMGKFSLAAESFQSALASATGWEGAWFFLGRSLLEDNRPTDAEKALRRALEIIPSSPPSHYYLGLALTKQKRNAEAVASFRKVTELDPDSDLGKNAARYLTILK